MYQTATFMRAPDDQRVLVAAGERRERPPQALLPLDEEVHGVPKLERGGGVPHVVGRQPHVDEPGIVAELLLEAGQQRDHLVLDLLLDGQDAPDVDARGADPVHDRARDPALPGVRLADGDLDPQPRAVLRLLAPDPPHRRPRVPIDHEALTLTKNATDW
jgi:hypothetical protein